MQRDSIVRAYTTAVFDTDKDAAFGAVNAALASGLTAEEVLFDVVVPATEELMSAITKDPDANLAQHFMTAQIAGEVTDRMLVLFAKPPQIVGRAVIGTSAGDLHSLGKRIVSGCLRALMVETVDLGVNVQAERFVEEALLSDAQVIAISSMMVHTAIGESGCRRVRAILKDRGLEERFKIVVGGAPFRFDEKLYETVGADGWAADGLAAARLITSLMKRGGEP